MNPKFLNLGSRWLNVSAVESVEVSNASGEGFICVVYFSGRTNTTVSGDNAKKLVEWLHENKIKFKESQT